MPRDLQGKGGASDIVQESLFEAQRDLDHFQGDTEQELLAWVRSILANNLANFGRHYHDVAKRQVSREIPLDNSSRRELRESLVIDLPSPSAMASSSEQLSKLEAALEKLPAPYREVVVWRNLDLLPFTVIARRLSRTEKSVQQLWTRAIRALRKILPPTI